MRIGEVSEKLNISIDNIYYYIHYGLVVPPKPKGQYNFDTNTVRDIKRILELKEMGFSLKEIHNIMSLFRISNLADVQDIKELRTIYEDKIKDCLRRREEIDRTVNILEKNIKELDSISNDGDVKRGLPVRMLTLLACPVCRGKFNFSGADMDQRYIFEADVSCHCGYKARISQGVFMTPNVSTSGQYDKPDIMREMYKDQPPSLITLYQRAYNWMGYKLKNMDLQNKVVAETYVNACCFMHNHLHLFPPDGMYIIIDKFPETLQMYKGLIERQGYDLDILYIADSSLKWPLKHQIIDIHIDFFASNEHNIYKNDFLLRKIKRYLRPKASALGTYFYFVRGRKSVKQLMREYPDNHPENFSKNYFTRNMRAPFYKITDQEEMGYVTNTGTNIGLGFHIAGEELHLLSYLGELL